MYQICIKKTDKKLETIEKPANMLGSNYKSMNHYHYL